MMTGAMIKVVLVVGALVVAATGAVANALWGPKAQARKRLDAGAKTEIADREIVTLTGTVRAVGELLEAPISGKSCVLYEAVARVYEAGPRNTQVLAAQIAEQKLVAFDLETAQGMVRVEGETADVELPHNPVIPRKIERERTFLREHGRSGDDIRGAGFDELALEPGTKIRVQGMAIIEVDPGAAGERGFRDESPRRIRLVAHEGHPLTIGRPRR